MLNKLFLLHRDYLIYIFNQDLPQSGIDSLNKLINYTNMFYSIKKISPNTFIIDL
jgi:lipopolysaccharide biosynthesis glycosyltransferase